MIPIVLYTCVFMNIQQYNSNAYANDKNYNKFKKTFTLKVHQIHIKYNDKIDHLCKNLKLVCVTHIYIFSQRKFCLQGLANTFIYFKMKWYHK